MFFWFEIRVARGIVIVLNSIHSLIHSITFHFVTRVTTDYWLVLFIWDWWMLFFPFCLSNVQCSMTAQVFAIEKSQSIWKRLTTCNDLNVISSFHFDDAFGFFYYCVCLCVGHSRNNGWKRKERRREKNGKRNVNYERFHNNDDLLPGIHLKMKNVFVLIQNSRSSLNAASASQFSPFTIFILKRL